MSLILNFILFFLAAVVSFYIPGAVLLSFLKLKLEKHLLFLLSWFLGTVFFILLSYLSAWIGMPYLVLGVLFLSLGIALYKREIFKAFAFKAIDIWSVSLILIGTFFFVSNTFMSGMVTKEGYQLFGVNTVDSVVHLAHIKSQTIFFPPVHPGLAGIEFRGYHYFYDFLLSRFAVFYNFSVEDLFFRFFPTFISLLYGAGFFFIASVISKSQGVKRLILFLAYFAQNFSFLLLFTKHNYSLIHSSQLISPVGLIFDPSVIFSIAFLVVGIALLPKVKESWKYALVAGFLLGILAQTKIYSGIIGISALIIYSLIIFFQHKTKYLFNFLLALFVTGVLTIVTYFPNNFGVGHLTYEPLLIYRQYMQQSIFGSWHWEIKRIIYADHNNLIRIIQLYIEAVLVFWIINLGIRIAPLFFIKKTFSKSFWSNDYMIILFAITIVSILIPSFFLQSLSAFDIQQFLWIVLALLSIATGMALARIMQNKIFAAVVIIIFAIGMYQNMYAIYPYLIGANKLITSHTELEVYSEVTKRVPEKEFVVSLFPVTSTIPTVSAFTARSVYYEGEVIHYPLDNIYKEREAKLELLRGLIKNCKTQEIAEILKEIKSSFLLTPLGKDCFKDSPVIVVHKSSSTLSFYEFK